MYVKEIYLMKTIKLRSFPTAKAAITITSYLRDLQTDVGLWWIDARRFISRY